MLYNVIKQSCNSVELQQVLQPLLEVYTDMVLRLAVFWCHRRAADSSEVANEE